MSISSVNKLFKQFSATKGFNRFTQDAVVTKVTPELLQITVPVTEDICNNINTMHGGYTATVVDILSSMDIVRQGHSPGVSVELSVQYMSAAALNSTVVFESKLLKLGKKLVFCEVDIKDQISNKLLAKGKHIKYLL